MILCVPPVQSRVQEPEREARRLYFWLCRGLDRLPENHALIAMAGERARIQPSLQVHQEAAE
jgi:hypothetical protein